MTTETKITWEELPAAVRAFIGWPGTCGSKLLDDGSYAVELRRGGNVVALATAPTFDEAVRRAYAAAGVPFPEVAR